MFLGIYYHETHRTNAKTDRNIRTTTPRKTPNTTASNLRFGLNVEPKDEFRLLGPLGIVIDGDLLAHFRRSVGADPVLELDGPAVRRLEPH